MPAYSGKFQYACETGDILHQGPCQVAFDEQDCIVTPSSGAPLAFDLGDIDRVTPGEQDLKLALYTGRNILLSQFGSAFLKLRGELLAAWRDRTVQCLLIEDLELVGGYQGAVNETAGEVRIYKSNIAFLPDSGTPIQWRLAEIDSIIFDASTHRILVSRGADRLALSKFGRKTDEVRAKIDEAWTSVRKNTAATLHSAFPFLSPDQLARLVTTMPEGRSTPLAALNEIHPKLAEALLARAVDETLQAYFDALRSRMSQDSLMAGFKFTRASDEEKEGESSDAAMDKPSLFFWFFFPLPNQLAAWEATTGSGRATYFFRAPAPFTESVASLTRSLASVSFRREPVYLADESLDREPRFHRYAIAARRLPGLRLLRAAYLGRAIHSTPEEWRKQLEAFVGTI